jgi:hypothetical protein
MKTSVYLVVTFFAIAHNVTSSLISFSIVLKKSFVTASLSSDSHASFSDFGAFRTIIKAGRAYWLTVLCAPTPLYSSSFTAVSANVFWFCVTMQITSLNI